MKEQIAFITDNVKIFSVIGYGIGLIYMSLFYYCFDVPIINYLSLNDILLSSVTLIIPVLITLLVFEYLLKGLSNFFFARKLIPTEKATFSAITSFLLMAIVVISFYIEDVRRNPNLQFYIFFTWFVLLARLGRNREAINLKPALAICLIGLFIGLYYLVESAKAGFGNKDVKFNYFGEVITTGFSHDLNYIGETSSTIFLYNFRKKVTNVYEKSNITKLRYIDKIEREFSPKTDIELYAFNAANYKVSTDTIYKPFEWSTHDFSTFLWTAEKNPVGLSRLIWELNYILDENDLDFDDPTHSHSSLPIKMDIVEDYKEASEALNSGNCEVHKKWESISGEIDLQLNKKFYLIQIDLKIKKK